MTVSFDPSLNNERPALLLENGHIIISWASHCDNGAYHGWVMSYGANTLAQEGILNTSPNGALSGVWMSGNGPAADANGNIYFSTGNGSWDGATNFGDSIVKLGPPSSGGFSVADYFTPTNQQSLSNADSDVGAGGVLLLPDLTGGSNPHLIVEAGKEGKIYLVDKTSLGHMCQTNCGGGDSQIVQEMPSAVGGMWGSPAYWNGSLYFGGSSDRLKAFSISASSTPPIATSPTSHSSISYNFPGPTPSVSASGNTNGIVWALDNSFYCTEQSGGCGAAVLHAYSAASLGTELWNSAEGSGNRAGNAVKFTVPTVANGKVYIGTRGNSSTTPGTVNGEIDVYGLLPN